LKMVLNTLNTPPINSIFHNISNQH
jgi:hypothetical protein